MGRCLEGVESALLRVADHRALFESEEGGGEALDAPLVHFSRHLEAARGRGVVSSKIPA